MKFSLKSNRDFIECVFDSVKQQLNDHGFVDHKSINCAEFEGCD
jgi:hypothetical protein